MNRNRFVTTTRSCLVYFLPQIQFIAIAQLCSHIKFEKYVFLQCRVITRSTNNSQIGCVGVQFKCGMNTFQNISYRVFYKKVFEL